MGELSGECVREYFDNPENDYPEIDDGEDNDMLEDEEEENKDPGVVINGRN